MLKFFNFKYALYLFYGLDFFIAYFEDGARAAAHLGKVDGASVHTDALRALIFYTLFQNTPSQVQHIRLSMLKLMSSFQTICQLFKHFQLVMLKMWFPLYVFGGCGHF